MTWRTQLGERSLEGAEAALIREALGQAVDMVEEELAGYPDPWEFGIVLFDRLEPLAKLALLADVGWALLRETETCPKLTAVNEAAVAVFFSAIEQWIHIEIDSQDDADEPFFWRCLVLAALHKDGETTDLPDQNCTDASEWEILVEVLSQRILWDDDFNDADRFLDAPPETAAFLRDRLAIDDDYFQAIPPDPRDSDLPRIRAVLRELYGG